MLAKAHANELDIVKLVAHYHEMVSYGVSE